LILALSLPICAASIAVTPTAEEMFNQSTLVVLGKVVSIKCYPGGVGGIYTAVGVQVETIYKGNVSTPIIEVDVPGGSIGAFGVWVDDQPTFGMGEHNLLYLTRPPVGVVGSNCYGLTTGSFMAVSKVNEGYTYGPMGDRFLLPEGRSVDYNPPMVFISDLELIVFTLSMVLVCWFILYSNVWI